MPKTDYNYSQVIIKGSCNTCGSKTVQTDLDAYMEVHASLLIDGVNVCTNVQALS